MYVVDDVQPDGADHDIELTDEQRRRARQRAIRAVASGNVIDFMPGDGVTDRQFGVVVGGDNGFQPMVYVTFERESRQVYGQ